MLAPESRPAKGPSLDGPSRGASQPSSDPSRPSSSRRRAFRRAPRPVLEGRLYWWHVPLALFLLALGVWIGREQWVEIYEYATRDQEYSHILLTLPVAGLLVWVRRLRLRHFRVSGAWTGVAIVLAGLIARERGFEFNRQILQHAGTVMIAIGCVMSVLGQSALTRFFPAVLALAFLVPVPGELRQQIAVQLQQATATITQAILGAVGVETRVIGNTLSINGKELIVAEACNGMRLVFPLVMITFVFAFSIPLRNSVRLVLLLASPLVALVCNVIRTVPTVWIHGQFTDPAAKFPEQFHDAAGWAMLPLAFVVLMALIRVLRWAQVPVQRYTLANQ